MILVAHLAVAQAKREVENREVMVLLVKKQKATQ